jgi:hypothetical protein
MAQYGVGFGIVLLIAVTAVALLLAGQAARSVRQFREEHHVGFVGREEQK